MRTQKGIQHAVEIDFLAYRQMVLRLCHVVQQKFQQQRAAETAALDLEMRKAHGQIRISDVSRADEARIFHCLRKPIAPRAAGRGAAVLHVLAEILTADRFVARSPLGAAKVAALVAEKFHFVLFPLRQRAELIHRPVQPEIRHDEAKLVPLQLPFKRPEIHQHLGGGGNEVQIGILSSEIGKQQFRMNDDAVSRRLAIIKKRAEGVALCIRKVLLL